LLTFGHEFGHQKKKASEEINLSYQDQTYQTRGDMDKFINKYGFMTALIDDEKIAERAGEIGEAILEAGSLRLTDITFKNGSQQCCVLQANSAISPGGKPTRGTMATISGGCRLCHWRPNRD
jgi:hypothetical protein